MKNSQIKKTRIVKDILIYLYFNGDNNVKRLQQGRPKKTILTKLSQLITEGWVKKVWYSSIPAFRNEKYEEEHYKLTNEGYRIAEDLPEIKSWRREKEIEYELDAYENELRGDY